jgi:hypothetical protein
MNGADKLVNKGIKLAVHRFAHAAKTSLTVREHAVVIAKEAPYRFITHLFVEKSLMHASLLADSGIRFVS